LNPRGRKPRFALRLDPRRSALFHFLKVIEGHGILRVQFQSALEMGLRIEEVAGFGERGAEIGFGHGIGRMETDGFGELNDGFIEFTERGVSVAEVVASGEIVGLILNGEKEWWDGRRGIAER